MKNINVDRCERLITLFHPSEGSKDAVKILISSIKKHPLPNLIAGIKSCGEDLSELKSTDEKREMLRSTLNGILIGFAIAMSSDDDRIKDLIEDMSKVNL